MSDKLKPITPEEALFYNQAPDEVIDVINNFLKTRYTNSDCAVIINKSELIATLVNLRYGDVSQIKEEIEKNNWLNFSGAYRQAGWCVEQEDKENDTYYTFTRKGDR